MHSNITATGYTHHTNQSNQPLLYNLVSPIIIVNAMSHSHQSHKNRRKHMHILYTYMYHRAHTRSSIFNFAPNKFQSMFQPTRKKKYNN